MVFISLMKNKVEEKRNALSSPPVFSYEAAVSKPSFPGHFVACTHCLFDLKFYEYSPFIIPLSSKSLTIINILIHFRDYLQRQQKRRCPHTYKWQSCDKLYRVRACLFPSMDCSKPPYCSWHVCVECIVQYLSSFFRLLLFLFSFRT